MLNKVILMGRLTADPELRHTASSIPVTSFTLAVNRDFKRDETDFIDIVAWRNQAEFVSKWFTKGQLVAVCGRLQVRAWKDKDGNNRRSYEVVADEVHFAESRRDSTGGAQRPVFSGGPSSLTEDPTGFSDLSDDDDELPF